MTDRLSTGEYRHDANDVLWSLAADSVRGFLMAKNVGWDDLDPWTDNIIARVREQVQIGGPT